MLLTQFVAIFCWHTAVGMLHQHSCSEQSAEHAPAPGHHDVPGAGSSASGSGARSFTLSAHEDEQPIHHSLTTAPWKWGGTPFTGPGGFFPGNDGGQAPLRGPGGDLLASLAGPALGSTALSLHNPAFFSGSTDETLRPYAAAQTAQFQTGTADSPRGTGMRAGSQTGDVARGRSLGDNCPAGVCAGKSLSPGARRTMTTMMTLGGGAAAEAAPVDRSLVPPPSPQQTARQHDTRPQRVEVELTGRPLQDRIAEQAGPLLSRPSAWGSYPRELRIGQSLVSAAGGHHAGALSDSDASATLEPRGSLDTATTVEEENRGWDVDDLVLTGFASSDEDVTNGEQDCPTGGARTTSRSRTRTYPEAGRSSLQSWDSDRSRSPRPSLLNSRSPTTPPASPQTPRTSGTVTPFTTKTPPSSPAPACWPTTPPALVRGGSSGSTSAPESVVSGYSLGSWWGWGSSAGGVSRGGAGGGGSSFSSPLFSPPSHPNGNAENPWGTGSGDGNLSRVGVRQPLLPPRPGVPAPTARSDPESRAPRNGLLLPDGDIQQSISLTGEPTFTNGDEGGRAEPLRLADLFTSHQMQQDRGEESTTGALPPAGSAQRPPQTPTFWNRSGTPGIQNADRPQPEPMDAGVVRRAVRPGELVLEDAGNIRGIRGDEGISDAETTDIGEREGDQQADMDDSSSTGCISDCSFNGKD